MYLYTTVQCAAACMVWPTKFQSFFVSLFRNIGPNRRASKVSSIKKSSQSFFKNGLARTKAVTREFKQRQGGQLRRPENREKTGETTRFWREVRTS